MKTDDQLNSPRICAWCKAVIGHSPTAEISHGICTACYRLVTQTPHLSAAELDALPFGVIELDAKGLITKYNRSEANSARHEPEKVIGRNFFSELAPCSRVQEFRSHYDELLKSCDGSGQPQFFSFTFHLEHETQLVEIILVPSKEIGGAIVNIKRVSR